MARALWSGSVSFGLVNVPVRLMSGTVDKDIHFHQVDEKNGDRIRHKRVSERTGREVDSDRIANGFERSSGSWVIVTSEELSAADPERTHTIDVDAFVPLAEIDPLQFDRAYWVVPEDQEGAKKAYALLRTAMEETDRIAIGRFVLRTRERLVALRPLQGALALHTMRFADELVKASSLEGLPVRTKAPNKELAAAEQLIDSLSTEFDPGAYRDEYREQLLSLIERKAEGEDVLSAPAPEEPQPTGAPDLMSALEESIAAVKGDGKAKRQAGKAKAKAGKPSGGKKGKAAAKRSSSRGKSKASK